MEAVITGNGTLNIDAKYCKHAIKSKGNLTVNAGNINVTSAPNKAVFARNEMTINDGKMDFSGVKNGMECSGNITVHGGIIIVNSTGDCIKAAPDDDDETAALPGAKDNLLTINGGSLNLTSTADDGMICTGNMNINGGEVTISAISKGIKAVGDFNVTGGKVDIVMDANTTGNEAIESKQKIHIKDGEFYIISNGDGINTAVEDGLTVTDASEYNEIVIDGGTFSICSNTDDGIDGNGNITINGGTFDLSGYSKGIVSHGIFTLNNGKIVVDMILDGDSSGQTTTDPWNNMGGMNRPGGNWGGGNSSAHEGEGLESKGKFIITGGILIGGGGDNSTPTTSVCKQYSASIGSLSEGQVLSIKDASGNTALIYKVEKSCNFFLVSTPEFQKNTTYTLYNGSSVSGTEIFKGVYDKEAAVSSETPSSRFTTSSYYVSISGGNNGGWNGRW